MWNKICLDKHSIAFFFIIFRYPDYITFPFTKNSPFFAPFNRVLRKLMESGTLSRIWNKYQSEILHECEEPQVKSLDYNQLLFPSVILATGLIFSCILGIFEKFCGNMKKI